MEEKRRRHRRRHRASYHTPPATVADNNSTYVCIASNPYGVVVSNAGIMTVASQRSAIDHPTAGRHEPPCRTDADLLRDRDGDRTAVLSMAEKRDCRLRSDGLELSHAAGRLLDNLSQFICLVSNAYGSIFSNPGA